MPRPLELFRFQIARDAAISKHTNPRNFEHVWYPFWEEVCNRLRNRADRYNLYVAPQYPLWRVHVLGDEANIKPSMTQVNDSDEENEDEDEEMFDAANMSASTVADTIKLRDSKRITDFALLLWKEYDGITLLGEFPPTTEDAIFPAAQPGVTPSCKILEYIPLLIEVKRQPSRDLMANNEEWQKGVRGLITKAKDDVLVQAAYLFSSSRWVHQLSVIVIATSGDYWSYTVADKGNIVSKNEGEDDDMDWEPDEDILDLKYGSWSKDVRYGSAESAKAESAVKLLIDELFL